MPKVKKQRVTRKTSEEYYGGGPCELSMTEPSTYRQLIQHFYHLNIAHPGTDFLTLVQQICQDLKYIWYSVNPRLPLITDKSINRKVKDLISLVKDINRHHGKARAKQNLDAKLDKLFDTASCSCALETVPCSRISCKVVNCVQEHIVCACAPHVKVPIEDRAYLRDQRSKTGPRGAYQMSSVDASAVKKCMRAEEAHQASAKRLLAQAKSEEMGSVMELPELSGLSSSSAGEEEEEEWQPEKKLTGDYSLLKFPRYAMELVRGECSSNLGAALGNALLHDIKHLLRPEVDINDIMIDKCKLDRAKAKVMEVSEGVVSRDKSQLVCVGIDGRVDENTLTYKEIETREGETVLRKCVDKEHHLTFTAEDGKSSGTYLTHRTIPVVGATGEVMAKEAFDVLQEYGSNSTISAILLDNTSVNTGWRNGLVVKLEESLGRKLHTVGCSLHQNELPFRAVFKKLDGETTGPTTFSGGLGKKCAKDSHDKPQVKFEAIGSPVMDRDIPDEVLKDLSHDQRLLFEYCKGIAEGKVNERWAARKIGPLNHARWLTLAIRVLCLYTRDSKPTMKLKMLVHFIVSVYAPAWFEIKASSKLQDSPNLLFQAICRLKCLPFQDVKAVAKKSIQGNAFCLLPDNFIYAMVKEEDEKVRKFGLQTVLKIRMRNNQVQKKIPQINWNAEHWCDLIDLNDIHIWEPPTIQHLSNEEIQSLIDGNRKPFIPDLPSHSQSVERSVKLVTDASRVVYGFENRHKSILTKILSRQSRPGFISKGHYSQSYDDFYD